MKIIIVGAGIGGLEAARLFAYAGAEVFVVERAGDAAHMRCDVTDDVDPSIFDRCGLPVPHGSFPKRDWTFVAPGGGVREMHEASPDISVNRCELDRMLIIGAEKAGAEMVWGVKCEGAIVEDGRVVGVKVNGEEAYADLVVDSGGMDSELKASLPGEMKTDMYEDDEKFAVFRTFFKRIEGAEEPQYSDKVYLKHLGEKGISWAIRRGDVDDVLIGAVGGLNIGDMNKRLEALRADDAGIGAKYEHGQTFFNIPVRFPATRAIAPGYAALGDAAYLTIPMLGSGIASALISAHLLAECVAPNHTCCDDVLGVTSIENLWKYQVLLYKTFAEHCGVDVMKRGVLSLDDETLDLLLTSDILTNEEVCALAKGRMLSLGVGELISKAIKAGSRAYKLLPVAAMLRRAKRATAIARSIPQAFDEGAIAAWEKRLKRAVRGKR